MEAEGDGSAMLRRGRPFLPPSCYIIYACLVATRGGVYVRCPNKASRDLPTGSKQQTTNKHVLSYAHAHSSGVRGVCKPSTKRIQGTPGHNGITKAVPLIPSLPHPHSDSIERRYLAQLRSFSVNPSHPSTCTQTFLYCSGAPELSCFIKGCCREDIVRL